MNEYDFIDAVNLVDDYLIEEAEKYGIENISAVPGEQIGTVRKNNIYCLISAAAACAVLCTTVNHFTSVKNQNSPEISNSYLTETTVTAVSESEQCEAVSDVITAVSTGLQPFSSDTSQSSEMTVSAALKEETHQVSGNILSAGYKTENKPDSSVPENAVTEKSDETEGVLTESETLSVQVTECSDEVTEITKDREGVFNPSDTPVNLLVYAKYNDKLYKKAGHKYHLQDSQLGEELTAVFSTGLYDEFRCTKKVYSHKEEYGDTALFLKIPDEDNYYLFIDFDVSPDVYYAILDSMPAD